MIIKECTHGISNVGTGDADPNDKISDEVIHIFRKTNQIIPVVNSHYFRSETKLYVSKILSE